MPQGSIPTRVPSVPPRPLLDALRTFVPGTIYRMASPGIVAAAMQLYRDGRILTLRWGKDGTAIQSVFEGEVGENLLVTLEPAGSLGFHCECADSQRLKTPCRHGLATLMLLLRLVKGTTFVTTKFDPEYLAAMEAMLLDKRGLPPRSLRYTLVIHSGPGHLGLRYSVIDPRGRKLTGRVPLPPGLSHAKGGFFGVSYLSTEDIADWIPKTDTWEAALSLKEKRISLRREPPIDAIKQATLRPEANGIHIRTILLNSDGKVFDNLTPVSDDLYFEPRSKRLVWIQNDEIGQFVKMLDTGWNQIPQTGPPDPGLTVLSDIPLLHVSASRTPGITFLDRAGEPIQNFPEIKPSFDLRIEHCGSMGNIAGCTLYGHAGGRAAPFLQMIQTHEAEVAYRNLPPTSRKSIVNALLEIVPRILSAPTAEDRAARIAEALRHPAFEKSSRPESYHTFFQHLGDKKTFAPRKHLLPIADTPGWAIVRNGPAQAARVLGLLREHLDAHSLTSFDRQPGEFECPMEILMPGLAAIMEQAGDLDLQILWNEEPIATATLDISFLAEPADIDWFELRPEVRADDLSLPQEVWAKIVAGVPFRAADGKMRVVDLASMERLRNLRKALGGGAPTRSQSQKDSTGTLRVSRLHLFDWLALREDGIRCELPAAQRATFEALLSFEGIPEHPLPAGLRATLRDYQQRGFEWLAFLYEHRFGACLADDMGLGKTLQTIALLASIHEAAPTDNRLPHLIVLPPTLIFNWRHEIATFYPDLEVLEYSGATRHTKFPPGAVVLTSYELARRDMEVLEKIPFNVIVFDEAQAVKNIAGERAKAMRRLDGRFRLCLTGTPMENHAGEYFAILELALPGLFGSYEKFRDNLKQGGSLLSRAKPFVLRRTKERILKELPPKSERDILLDLDPVQRELYTRAVGEVRAEVLEAYADRPAAQAGIIALAALTRLRQICVSPALLDPAYRGDSPKMAFLIDQLRELTDEGHAALVFSQFVKALDTLDRALTREGIVFQRMDGSTPMNTRKKLVGDFQSGKGPGVFLVSLKTGGAGLNLTRATYVFHLDPWWNPAVENQASDRVHRIGQTRGVFIHRLLVRHTIEEKMMELKQRKTALFERILSGSVSATGSAAISRDDFRFLLGMECQEQPAI